MLEFIKGAFAVAAYALPLTAAALILRYFTNLPDELFRKIQHFIFIGGYIPFLFAFATWWKAAILAVLVALALYAVILFAERLPAFSAYVTERRKGEYKNSLLLALLMMSVCICICWGLLGDKLLVLACAYAWGVGDAFAALIGKRFGKHKIRLKFADTHKSTEGSLAMLFSSAASVLIVLLIRGGLSIPECFLIAATSAAVCTAVELYTPNGFDTVTCPTAAMLVILPLCSVLA